MKITAQYKRTSAGRPPLIRFNANGSGLGIWVDWQARGGINVFIDRQGRVSTSQSALGLPALSVTAMATTLPAVVWITVETGR
jgi:hypothetical protein